jgi:hypothetical protein
MPTTDTERSKALKQTCSFSLSDLESQKSKFSFVPDNIIKAAISADIFRDLISFSPSSTSNLGEKLSNKAKKHIDEIVHDIVSALNVKTIYFYNRFESNKDNVVDLTHNVLNNSGTFMCLHCPNSLLESLYSSIRNALAHGNIAQKGKFYYLYSVSSQDGEKTPETQKKITFLLKVHSLNNLNLRAYLDAYKKYN